MAEQVRLGIIGTGYLAEAALLPAYTTSAPAAVVALCGRNRERAEELAVKYGVPAVFTDYREMYERAGLDGVVVASPDDLHYAMTMDALDRDLHVLCEKPMARTLADAQDMLAKAQKTGVTHMVNFALRAAPAYRYMKELIDEGYLGQPYQCVFSFQADYGRSGEYNWRWDQSRANGILGDLGSHMADLAHWLVGDITSVSALLGAFIPRPGPEGGALVPANDAAALAVRFAGGAQGTLQVSAVAHLGDRGMQQQVILYGAQGTLEADLAFNSGWAAVRGARADEPSIQPLPIPDHLLGPVDRSRPPFDQIVAHMVTQLRTFVDAIVENRPAVPSFADGVKAQAVIEAALRSQETGCAVAIADPSLPRL
jgi:predicted dehydrogenase